MPLDNGSLSPSKLDHRLPLSTALVLQNIRAQAEARDLPEDIIEQIIRLGRTRIEWRATAGRDTTVQSGPWDTDVYVLDNLQDSFVLVCMEQQYAGLRHDVLDGLAGCIQLVIVEEDE